MPWEFASENRSAYFEDSAVCPGYDCYERFCRLLWWRRSSHRPNTGSKIRLQRSLLFHHILSVEGNPYRFRNSHRSLRVRHTAGFRELRRLSYILRLWAKPDLFPGRNQAQAMGAKDFGCKINGSSRRRLSLTVSARRVENPDLLGNDFDDRPLLPIAILPTPALDPPLDEGVPPFGQEFGTDLCQPSERNDAEPLHGLLRDAFGVLPSFVHREVKAAYRLALHREFQLRCSAEKPNENHSVYSMCA